MIAKLKAPRVVWIMLPAGQVTEEAVKEFASKLSPGDIIIDGGNTHYKGRRAGARKRSNPSRSIMSTSARRAASGACNAATA